MPNVPLGHFGPSSENGLALPFTHDGRNRYGEEEEVELTVLVLAHNRADESRQDENNRNDTRDGDHSG